MTTPRIASIDEIAAFCREAITEADDDGLVIDNFNVVELCADRLTYDKPEFGEISLEDIRTALIVAGYGQRFPVATRPRH